MSRRIAQSRHQQQIEVGINDWAVEGKSGHLYFGRTAKEAMEIAQGFNFK